MKALGGGVRGDWREMTTFRYQWERGGCPVVWSGHDGGRQHGLWNLTTGSLGGPLSVCGTRWLGFLFNKIRIKTSVPDHTGAKSLLSTK